MRLPAFSIVMPTYQRRDVVSDAVRALTRLEYAGFVELIVVSDGSTDGTVEALTAITCPFPITVIQQTNAGAAAARNRGATEATGNILLFLDDDMICQADLLTEHARCYAEGADAVIGDFTTDQGSLPGFLSDAIAKTADASRDASAEGNEAKACDVFAGHLSIRRELFISLEGFDKTLTSGGNFAGEDTDLGVRLLRGHKLVRNPKALTRQRYSVTPRQFMKRAVTIGNGEAAFFRRYPALMGEFFAEQNLTRPIVQLLYRPLSRVPGLPWLLGAVFGRAGDLLLRTRWRHNRLFSRLFHAAWNVVYWSALERSVGAAFRRSVQILCYHAIQDHSGDSILATYGIPPVRFRRQLEWMARRGYHFISPQDFLDFLNGAGTLPPKPVLLTFDDCYQDLAEAVRNDLAPRGIPALAFCVAGIASNSNEWDQPLGAPRKALLSAAEMDRLRTNGLEVGSHSLTHQALPSLPKPDMIHEIRESVEVLERAGLPRPRFFAYPYGAHDHVSRREVRRAGFAAAFGVNRGLADRFCDRFDLPRTEILAGDGYVRFFLKIQFPQLTALAHVSRGALRLARL